MKYIIFALSILTSVHLYANEPKKEEKTELKAMEMMKMKMLRLVLKK